MTSTPAERNMDITMGKQELSRLAGNEAVEDVYRKFAASDITNVLDMIDERIAHESMRQGRPYMGPLHTAASRRPAAAPDAAPTLSR